MSVRNLDSIFRPQSVAVVGASDKPGKVGHVVVRNLIDGGFAGSIFPVNARAGTICGREAFADVASLPARPDLAIVCTPAETVPGIIEECAAAGILGVIVLTAGFREIGAYGRALEERVRQAAARLPGMRIVGPNCLGVIAPHSRLNASFAASTPAPGRVAFVSQSGAVCTAVLDWAMDKAIGFSYFVSVGNMLDVGISDLIDFLAADEHTDSLILYVESIDAARPFMSAARAFARNKPLVVYKAGRFAASAKAAASHTGALVGVDAVYEAAFQRAGAVRILEIDDMFDCAELLARHRRPKGPRLAIVTNAGGPGIMAVDCLLAQHGQLAMLSDATLERLNAALPFCWSHGNPIDVLGDAPPARFAAALEAALDDAGVDAVLVVLTPQAMTDATAIAQQVVDTAARHTKPVLAAWMGGPAVREGIALLNVGNIPSYATPYHAIRAFRHLVTYAENLETLHETPHEVPLGLTLERRRLTDVIAEARELKTATLSEVAAKKMLAAYSIPTSQPAVASSADAAVAAADRIGYPVVLKILSPQITHKTEVDGVVLNLASGAEVRAAFERIMATAARKRPDARLDGVTVQPMVAAPTGVELILGAKQDPVFGPVILAGMGGIAAEVLQDHALGLPPLNDRLARRMLRSLRGWPLLSGFRGRPPVDLESLVETLMRFSYLVADHPEIKEIDINPLVATPGSIVALDARVVLDLTAPTQPARPFAHLAIQPYPESFTRTVKLPNGASLVLRAIKAEDEPLWNAMIDRCSPETLRSRFGCLFKGATHSLAARYCFIDYERELALVAETIEEGQRQLVGVGRLATDPDRIEVEFALLVVDAWQGHGLGSLLTDACLQIAREWGLQRVVAVTEPTNNRMLAIFQHRGFQSSSAGDLLQLHRHLA